MDRDSLEQLLGQGLSLAEIGRRFDRTMRALHFHHVEPSQKRHEMNARGVAIALEKLRVEARKCVLVCSNCHAEVEDGITSIPTDALDSMTPSGVAQDDPG